MKHWLPDNLCLGKRGWNGLIYISECLTTYTLVSWKVMWPYYESSMFWTLITCFENHVISHPFWKSHDQSHDYITHILWYHFYGMTFSVITHAMWCHFHGTTLRIISIDYLLFTSVNSYKLLLVDSLIYPSVMSTMDVAWLRHWKGLWDLWCELVVDDLVGLG